MVSGWNNTSENSWVSYLKVGDFRYFKYFFYDDDDDGGGDDDDDDDDDADNDDNADDARYLSVSHEEAV